MPTQHIRGIPKTISVEELCDLLDDSRVKSSLDLGSALLMYAESVQNGPCLLISTICGKAAIVPL